MKIALTKAMLITTLCFMTIVGAFSQIQIQSTNELIAVTARPSADSIQLRWAPIDIKTWMHGNTGGYKVERFVISRNGIVLGEQERSVVHPAIMPLPEEQWEALVLVDKYAAIAAQALFGERFEIDLKQSDIFTIVNKVRENDQRFAFALFCADMSPAVARASGLWFTDRHVTKGEKYLYRISINALDSLRGSIFISPDDDYSLPKPQNLKADFKEQFVSLRWDKSQSLRYTAHIVERSENGKDFIPISDTPVVTVSPTENEHARYDYAIDSLKVLSHVYHYRVKGLTAFGEESPPSNVVSGQGTPSVTQVPYISSVESFDNTSLHIHWDFPEDINRAIKGFMVERSFEPRGTMISVSKKLLPRETRTYEDKAPGHVNYYRVVALGLDDQRYGSHPFFAQLIDSIPPAFPRGLTAKVNDDGVVNLSWQPNNEPDIYGYRIYKANHESDELAQITSGPIAETTFTDQVDLHTLNENIFYSAMAIDRNQNHSALSALLKVALPDKVKPQAPRFLPVKSDPTGVVLSWTPSSSEDVTHYSLYRRHPDKPQWEHVKTIPAGTDTIYHYTDDMIVPGKIHHYTVLAIDDAGLESAPALSVAASRIDRRLRPAVEWRNPVVNRDDNQVTLRWDYSEDNVESFWMYVARSNNQPVLYKSLPGEVRNVRESIIPGDYTYWIIAVFENGAKSSFSKKLTLQF